MKNRSLNTKFFFIVSLLVVSGAGVSWFGTVQLSKLNTSIENITGTMLPRVVRMGNLNQFTRKVAIAERNLALAATDEERKDAVKELESNVADVEKLYAETVPTLSSEGKELAKKFHDGLEHYVKQIGETREIAARKRDEATEKLLHESITKGTQARREAVTHLEAIIDLNEDRMAKATKDAQETYNDARNLMVMLAFFTAIASFALAGVILRALGQTIDKIIATLSASSQEVAQSSEQIAQAAEELSQASNEQASALQETSASTEEINSMVQKNTENARLAAESAERSLKSAQNGKETIEGMVAVIRKLESTNQEISEIVKVFTEIQDKTKVIDDIVFQTQLLSFNASVEAARAGEHGKGFAVVAEEVGNLAEMSGSASGEIGSLLSSSLKKVETTIEQVQAHIGKLVEEGAQGIKVLDQIVVEAQTASHKTQEISQASSEQSRGISEISRAMSQLDKGTQQNAATSEETASASEELSGQAVLLQNTVQELVAAVKGAAAAQAKLETVKKQSGARTKAKKAAAVNKNAENVVNFADRIRPGNGEMKKAAGAESFEDDSDYVNL